MGRDLRRRLQRRRRKVAVPEHGQVLRPWYTKDLLTREKLKVLKVKQSAERIRPRFARFEYPLEAFPWLRFARRVMASRGECDFCLASNFRDVSDQKEKTDIPWKTNQVFVGSWKGQAIPWEARSGLPPVPPLGRSG